MQTRIEIAVVGPDAPGGGRLQVYGPPAGLSKISILDGFARDFAIRNSDGAFSLKWVPKGAARYGVHRAKHLGVFRCRPENCRVRSWIGLSEQCRVLA
jgi:hypothetical protein